MSTVLQQPATTGTSNISTRLVECLSLQRKAYLANPNPDFAQRKADLLALKRMVIENQEALIAAISRDYGNRSRHETLIAEIIAVLDGINFSLKHLKRWMRPQRRHVDLTSFPGA